jgi:peptide-methionine (R)-S-oxide reductase
MKPCLQVGSLRANGVYAPLAGTRVARCSSRTKRRDAKIERDTPFRLRGATRAGLDQPVFLRRYLDQLHGLCKVLLPQPSLIGYDRAPKTGASEPEWRVGKQEHGIRNPLTRRALLAATGMLGLGALWAKLKLPGIGDARAAADEPFEVSHVDSEWRALLTPEQYRVLRREGTEFPFSSPLDHEKRQGTYSCGGCDLDLFSSSTKYDSGTGWPSFWKPLPHAVNSRKDYLLGMARNEVHCRRCGGHLGHVFDDGPAPTGLRYCMNGVALTFKAAG